MNLRLVLAPAFSLIVALPCSVVAAADNSPPPGFTALFNGKDLEGWKGLVAPQGGPPARAKMSASELAKAQQAADEKMHAHWKADRGMIVFDGKGDSLCSDKDYGDFELMVDWKIEPKGDSGVYLRGTPQVNLWDPDEPSYAKAGRKKGSGGLWNNKHHERFPLVRADKPLGQWNHFVIKIVGDQVTVHLNDKLVVDNVVLENYWEPGKPLYPRGSIELQAHNNPLYVKNIYVRELAQ